MMGTRESDTRYRREQAERGLVQGNEWIPAERRADLALFAAFLRWQKSGANSRNFQAERRQDADFERLAESMAAGDAGEFSRLLESCDLQRLADWPADWQRLADAADLQRLLE